VGLDGGREREYGTFADAAASGELVLNRTAGTASLARSRPPGKRT